MTDYTLTAELARVFAEVISRRHRAAMVLREVADEIEWGGYPPVSIGDLAAAVCEALGRMGFPDSEGDEYDPFGDFQESFTRRRAEDTMARFFAKRASCSRESSSEYEGYPDDCSCDTCYAARDEEEGEPE